MIENQSDNIDDKEIDASPQDNTPEDVSSAEDELPSRVLSWLETSSSLLSILSD